MGNRLSKIVTKTGDDGTTGLAGGGRIRKDHIRMETIGAIDELNSFIGLFIESLDNNNALREIYLQIQNDLFDLGGELAMPEYTMIYERHCEYLEEKVQEFNEPLEPLKDFILPSGSEALSRCHIVRSTARRAERNMVGLSAIETVNSNGQKYLNRLSDFAFVSARWLAHVNNEPEVLWKPSEVKAS
jgi:cob(I)alamin adenosyltransferase